MVSAQVGCFDAVQERIVDFELSSLVLVHEADLGVESGCLFLESAA